VSDIDAQLQAFLDRPCGPYNSWDEVNLPMVRHWCEAMGDGNPVYTDPEAAAASVHGGLVAPPAMLQVWTMRGVTSRWATGSDTREPFEVFEFLNAQGYPAVVAVNCEQTYYRYLRPGDRIHHTSRIESISPQKTTALGVGYFVTELEEYWDQDGEKVGDMRFRLFRYRAHERPKAAEAAEPSKPAKIGRFRPVENHDTKFFWEGVRAGKLLVQRCKDCGTLRHPPGPMCPSCQSLAWEAVESSGRGTVHSYVVMHHPQIPPFDYPNTVLLVELEEGTRLITQLVDAKPEDAAVGTPVEVVFREVEEGLVLPLFRIRQEA
jgi:uncharacterized OB-fold protein/acyl dehydratase